LSSAEDFGDCVTYEFILNTVVQARVAVKKRAISFHRRSTASRSIVSKAGRVVNKFLRRLGFELKRYINYSNFYYVSDDEKALAIDFLAYVMRAKPMLCLNVFDERDRVEVLKFVRNKVYCALLSSIDPALLFDGKDLELQREYKILRSKVRRKGDYYVLKAYSREYKLSVNHFEMPVFHHKYGISELPREVVEGLKGRDFVDGGAFIGDSALVLSEFKPRRIYAFEPLGENYNLLLKTIQLNNLQSIVIPVKKALGSTRGTLRVIQQESASFVSDIYKLNKGEEVEVVTLDDFIEENNIDAGLIKLDVEGYELEVLKGAEETIRKHKPVMSIAVYHRGQDFFETPRLVKSLVPEYKLRFLNLNAESACNERVLLAYRE
jgi:FkbM family methyltransferase